MREVSNTSRADVQSTLSLSKVCAHSSVEMPGIIDLKHEKKIC